MENRIKTKSFKDLWVWQKAKDLAVIIYKITRGFPKSETYGLASQMQRATISISSNIAESYHRFHQKEKDQFLSFAFDSGAELESQIEVAKTLYPKIDYRSAEIVLDEIMKILNKFLIK
jgi:four helix bundle protein